MGPAGLGDGVQKLYTPPWVIARFVEGGRNVRVVLEPADSPAGGGFASPGRLRLGSGMGDQKRPRSSSRM